MTVKAANQPAVASTDEAHFGDTGINVSEPERVVSLIGGTALAVLGVAMHDFKSIPSFLGSAYLLYRGLTGHCLIYDELHINTAVTGLSQTVSVPHEQGIKVERTITVNRTPHEVYTFWRQLNNLPRFMHHLESVEILSDTHSHWVAKGPAGMKIEWDAEIVNDVPDQVIGWRSVDGAMINNAGSVRFTRRSDDRGTEIRVDLKYEPLAGTIGATFAKLFGEEPSQQIEEDLQRFKQLMETGEIPSDDMWPSGIASPRY